jgi:hypothetical protein
MNMGEVRLLIDEICDVLKSDGFFSQKGPDIC